MVILADGDVAGIQALVDTYNTIISAAGSDTVPNLTASDYAKVGVTVSSDAVALLNNGVASADTSDVDTVAKLQAIAEAASRIGTLASAGTGTPCATDYIQVGITDVTATNVSAYNSAVEASGVNTSSELQAVVTTINTIAAAANSNPATVPSFGVADYAAIGVTVSAPSLGLVNSSIGSQVASASNTNTKLNSIVTAANKILATVGTSGQNSGLTVADFTALGVVGVADTNLDDAVVVIAGAQSSDVQTVSAIQALLSDVLITPLPVPTLQFYALLLLALLMLAMSFGVRRRV